MTLSPELDANFAADAIGLVEHRRLDDPNLLDLAAAGKEGAACLFEGC